MYYTDGSSDGTRVATTVVHKEEEIFIRFNDFASILDAEMTAIRVALENASETRDTITIHTDSLTAVNNYEGHQTRGIQPNTEANYQLDTRPYWNTR